MRWLLPILLLPLGCDPTFADDAAALAAQLGATTSPTVDLPTSYRFEIDQGDHHSNHDFVARPHLGSHVDRLLRFTAVFEADAEYLTANPLNQSDWNKLMGLTTDRIHQNSIRLGWRWNPVSRRVELGFYGYLAGTQTMTMLTDVGLGESIDCELRMTDTGLEVRAGGASHQEQGSLGAGFVVSWVLHSAYFGGDETAPHDIHVDVTNVMAQ